MDSVEVSCTPDGVPESFVIQGSTWRVGADVVRWFERTPWWDRVASIPREQKFKLDVEVWQLQAYQERDDESGLVTFVLVRNQNTGEWALRSMNDLSS